MQQDHPAARALAILIPQCDGAVSRDDCGLNKFDAEAYREYGAADLDRWAGRLAKYRRQIGDALADECKAVAAAFEKRKADGIYLLVHDPSSDRFIVQCAFKQKDDARNKAEIACGRRVMCWNHDDCPRAWSVTKWTVKQLLASGHFALDQSVDPSTLPDPDRSAAPARPAIPLKTHEDFEHTPERTPFKFQAEGIDAMCAALVSHQAFINADEMGIGKTLQALGTTFAHGFKMLGICPAGARMVWANEVIKSTTDMTVYVYKSGLTDKKKAMLFGADAHRIIEDSGKADVIIASYEGCRNLVMDNPDPETAKFHTMKKVPKERLAKWLNEAIVVVDEVQLMKNPRAARSQAAYAIIREAKCKIAMSGTPITNRPDDFWGCLCACGLNLAVAPTKREFYDRYVDGNERDNLHAKLVAAPWFIRRLKRDVMKDLPDKQWCDLIVDFDPKLQSRYNDALRAVQSGEPTRMLKGLTDMQTVANEAKVKPVTEWLIERVDAEQVTVVQCTRTAPLMEIQAKLRMKGIRAETLTGTDNDHSRAQKIKDFQDGNVPVMLTTLDSAITLTRSDTVLLYDADWTPAKMNQRVDRCHRIGQTNAVTIFRCKAASIDHHKYDIVGGKAIKISEILDGTPDEPWDQDACMAEVVLRLKEEEI